MRRRLTAVVLSATTFAALGGAATARAADTPILGFSDKAAKAQRGVEAAFNQGVSPQVIGETSRALSEKPHLLGTSNLDGTLAYSVQRLRSYGLEVSTPTYSVYASRPRSISVTQTAPSTRQLSNIERAFSWQQDFGNVVVGYNAYSPSGKVSGELVYANYGLPSDYAELARLGVDVRGKIVLVRYGGSFRGVKAQQAEQRGAKGLIIYSDPEDDGYKRGAVYPDGPWRPSDGIQRGSIQYIFEYPGDPLTPDAPSLAGTPRLAPADAGNLPRIPTTPISYGEAKPLLEALGGPTAPDSFQGGLPFTYHVGPGATKVRMDLDIAYEQTPVRNVLAVIPGATRPQERVVLGAHYDAWTYGASDNTSGWAAIMEIGRSLGQLLRQGWRPDRTIVLAGWSGEEYGLLGSTEWVEQFQRDLARDAVAYGNLDIAGGTSFDAAGVPQLDDALIEITKAVTDQRTGTSVYDVWKGGQSGVPAIGRLGSGSDYTGFLDHVGVPSFQAGFTAPAQGGTYHSAYDDTFNTEHYLDPGYLGDAGSARVTGVSAMRLADAQVLPFHYSDYAAAVAGYLADLQRVMATPGAAQVDLRPLVDAAASWKTASEGLEARAEGLLRSGAKDTAAIARVNDALMQQERALTTSRGLPGRPWFKHQIYAPGLVTGYAAQFLPGMRDAVEQGDEQTARTYRDLLLASLNEATRLAKGGAT